MFGYICGRFVPAVFAAWESILLAAQVQELTGCRAFLIPLQVDSCQTYLCLCCILSDKFTRLFSIVSAYSSVGGEVGHANEQLYDFIIQASTAAHDRCSLSQCPNDIWQYGREHSSRRQCSYLARISCDILVGFAVVLRLLVVSYTVGGRQRSVRLFTLWRHRQRYLLPITAWRGLL